MSSRQAHPPTRRLAGAPSAPPPARCLLKIDNWCHLASVAVEIHRNGKLIKTGLVDAATADSTKLWLSQDGLEGRSIIHKLDGYEVWAEPQHVQTRPY